MKMILFSSENKKTCGTTSEAFHNVAKRKKITAVEYTIEKNPEKFSEYGAEGFPLIFFYEGKKKIYWTCGNQTETSLENILNTLEKTGKKL